MKAINGVILVDKPAGPTSARVVSRLKRLLDCEKVGHAGTLDPPATGLLVILCGKASKLQEFFLGEEKTYSGTIRLGVITATDDAAGQVVEDRRGSNRFQEHAGRSPQELAAIAAGLIERYGGRQLQTPPQVSAVKIGGERAYKAARRNQTVEIAPREVFVSKLELAFSAPDVLRYLVRASKGFYVRSLARDIGEHLGTGACIESLRRIESAPFPIEQAVPLEQIEREADPARFVIPLEDLPLRLARIGISPESYQQLCRGDQSPLKGLQPPDGSGASAAALLIDGIKFGGVVECGPQENYRIRFLV